MPLSNEFLRCRSLGHPWEKFNPLNPPQPQRGLYIISLRCPSCTTERYDHVTRSTGTVYHREYRYPKGYAFTKDEMPSRDEFRRLMINREIRNQKKKADNNVKPKLSLVAS